MAYIFDFDSIKARIITRLRSKSSWANIAPYSTNARLIDAFAEELADLALYDEYLTRENKWSLARNESSLIASTALHRYNAHRKVGSTDLIRVSASDVVTSLEWLAGVSYSQDDTVYYNNFYYKSLINLNLDITPGTDPLSWDLLNISPSVNIDIPKWTVFSNESGDIKFTTYEVNTLIVGQDYIDVNVRQGTPITYSIYAQGLDNEEFVVVDSTIENTTFELYKNGILQTKVENLLEYGANDAVYEIENIIDFSGIYLKFGNDIYGKKLALNDLIEFKYVSTLGSSGNIHSSNIITKVQSTLYDTNANKVTAYCNNLSNILGGQESEDIESVRLNAPRIFQAGERASSNADYEAILLTFSFVLKSIVWGSYETNLDNNDDPWTFIPLEENVVHVAAISQAGTNLTYNQKISISESINTYKSPTDIVTFEDVRFLNLRFNINAYVTNTSYTLSQVSNNIRAAINGAYSYTTLNLYENIYFSDYQSLIDNVAGVDHHTSFVEIFYDYAFSSGYVTNILLPSTDIRSGSISVYIQDTVGGQTDWTKIATDNSGLFVAEPTYTIDAVINQIVYSTGQGILKLISGPSPLQPYGNYTVRVYYRLSGDDLLLENRYDIFNISADETIISIAYQKV